MECSSPGVDAVLQRAAGDAQPRAREVGVHEDLLVAAVADDLVGRVPGDALGAGAPVHDGAVGADHVHPVADGVEDVPERAVYALLIGHAQSVPSEAWAQARRAASRCR